MFNFIPQNKYLGCIPGTVIIIFVSFWCSVEFPVKPRLEKLLSDCNSLIVI